MFRSAGDKIRFFNSHAAKSYSNNGRKMEFLKPYQHTCKVSELVFVDVSPASEITQLTLNIPHVFYMFYMNILYVIGCKNTHTGLLKLYNQFYVNIVYEIVCKNVHTFMKKNIWILLANFR